jgi:hypothetical protein
VRFIWSDESSFTLFPTSGTVTVWRTPNAAYRCLVPTAKHGAGSVMVSCSVGPIITLHGRNNAREHMDSLRNQVHPIISEEQCCFPRQQCPHSHSWNCSHSWFGEHKGELQQLPWPEVSPHFNITEPLWSILETRMRNISHLQHF